MLNKLKTLQNQVSSLEGANLEFSIPSASNFFKEIKSFLEIYNAKDFENLSRL